MRITVLGKSPSWQDAGGACSGYLVEEGGTCRAARLRQRRVLASCAATATTSTSTRSCISHLHADHFLDLVPFSYALTYAPRQQPVPVDRWPGTDSPARPRLLRAARRARDVPPRRRRVGQRRPDRERVRPRRVRRRRDARGRAAARSLPARCPHFIRDVRDRASRSTNGGGRFTFGADCRPTDDARRVRARHRPADDRGDAAAPGARRRARPPHARARRASTRARARRRAARAHPHLRRARRAVGARARPRRAFGGPVEVAARGRRLRRLSAAAVARRLERVRCAMSRERDLFANFERMRREMDELFGDVFERAALAPRSAAASRPRVDVFYAGDPPRAVVTPSWPASTPTSSASRSRAASCVIAGQRRPADAEGRVYQQLEIEHGPFRRAIQLGADVVAEEARGDLRGRHPARRAAARAAASARTRSVPIEVAREPTDDAERRDRRSPAATSGARGRGRRRRASCPATLPVLPLRETVPFPDTLTPLAVGQERSVQLVNDVLAGNRMLVMVAVARTPSSRTPGPDDLYDVGVVGVDRAHAQGARRDAAHPRPGRPARADRRAGSRETPYLVAEIDELPDVVERVARARRRSCATSSRRSSQIVEAGALPARGAAARGRQRRRPGRARAT